MSIIIPEIYEHDIEQARKALQHSQTLDACAVSSVAIDKLARMDKRIAVLFEQVRELGLREENDENKALRQLVETQSKLLKEMHARQDKMAEYIKANVKVKES